MMFKAAAVQMCSGVDPARNAETMAELVREAALRGAGYVQTPEMTGAIQRDRSGLRSILRDEANDIVVRKAARLAGELAIYLHVGSTPIALADGKIANRGFLFGPDGAKICEYDKIHMFDVDLENGESWRESAAYHPGATARIADLPFGKLGFSICYMSASPNFSDSRRWPGPRSCRCPRRLHARPARRIGRYSCGLAQLKTGSSSLPRLREARMRTGGRPSATR